ncbi:hemerythrin [Breznakibacter xylanolyticus]|uniref:Hemerythrin n=1 Tax=Breznakibacter xylanolyticus TaxID=990 RepID=A0A2W7Q0K7_9BACT|nr:bacteriohemerythrin [Breznakibacter xylanolyticus]MBN2742998.1 hemerythrin family protein [Marinilabiliaceae bacterium]PZX15329.1 hemerythrin [Breznakibacter xylanolyticus]
MYEWTTDLAVDDLLIDKEHQHLFELLERYYLGLKGQKAPMDLLLLVKGLIDYAQTHFSHEEALMLKSGYPDIERHKQLHRTFMLKVNDFYTKLSDGKLVLTLEVTNYIKNWLVAHIKSEDVKIGAFLKRN